jgi:hypothetical protein
MEPEAIRAKLCEVLNTIQTLLGEPCQEITPSMRPAKDLPKFTSKIWPVAAAMLGTAIGKALPPERNIFADPSTRAPLAIEQTVALVCGILKSQAADEKEEAA